MKRIWLAAVVLGVAGMATAQEKSPTKLPGSDIIPAERLADWRAGVTVGVPGGIPTDRTKLIDVTKEPYKADNTGKTDAQPAIMKAVGDAKEKEVVYLPAGTYRIDKGINIRYKKNITVRGDGPDKTRIVTYQPNRGAFEIGGEADWQWNQVHAITGSPKKGDTELTLGDTKFLDGHPNGGVGMFCRIDVMNDLTLPVVGGPYAQREFTRVVGKTATTITISPGLLFDLPENRKPRVAVATRQGEGVGVEDLRIDCKEPRNPHGLIYMIQCYGCWVKNVTVMTAPNRHIWLTNCVQCQIEHCYIAKRLGEGTNGAGILVDATSFCLFEDNILRQQFPLIEVVAGSSGNVYRYNYFYDSTVYKVMGCSIDTNHGAHNSYSLYEGNMTPNLQADGYFGSVSEDTLFRNWFYGSSPGGAGNWTMSLNRFTRNYNIVANILGTKGLGNGPISFGNPNMGNGSHEGEAQPSKGKYWANWEQVKAGHVALPGGFPEQDLDVETTTLLKGNYYYNTGKVPDKESVKGVNLPRSLYLKEKPKFFGNRAWPAFGADVDFEKNKIPAQVRFEGMTKEEKD